jgi:hypothetical protein
MENRLVHHCPVQSDLYFLYAVQVSGFRDKPVEATGPEMTKGQSPAFLTPIPTFLPPHLKKRK